MGRILTEQEKETFIANRDRLLNELNELQADFEDLSNEDLIELRDVMLDRINICLKAILEDEKDYDIDVEVNTNDIDQIKNQAIDEFSKALIDKLEDYKTKAYVTGITDNPYEFGACSGMNSAMKIVNEMTEEYKHAGLEGENEYEYDRE